ncbi:sterile alpha motif domain-containing protein 1-like [Lagenorhynchus albirostris]|uniref:sterile alpha motif domain-containing protein 1-like n=1 Tax=Lagenorhynchus albirostris TaxID=27610 RepID=UPI0028EDFDCC|nr:sterile alpha motif domain-containing protein 1-like [Lagenorhynchus albirostris]
MALIRSRRELKAQEADKASEEEQMGLQQAEHDFPGLKPSRRPRPLRDTEIHSRIHNRAHGGDPGSGRDSPPENRGHKNHARAETRTTRETETLDSATLAQGRPRPRRNPEPHGHPGGVSGIAEPPARPRALRAALTGSGRSAAPLLSAPLTKAPAAAPHLSCPGGRGRPWPGRPSPAPQPPGPPPPEPMAAPRAAREVTARSGVRPPPPPLPSGLVQPRRTTQRGAAPALLPARPAGLLAAAEVTA